MLNLLLELIRSEQSPPLLVHMGFKFLYIISKVTTEIWINLHLQGNYRQMDSSPR
jgi:hypothetical protein